VIRVWDSAVHGRFALASRALPRRFVRYGIQVDASGTAHRLTLAVAMKDHGSADVLALEEPQEIVAAEEKLKRRHNFGKIVLTPPSAASNGAGR